LTPVRIGLISDTHGRLRPEVFTHFAGVERILHAGDIGPLRLLADLEALAPVTAVSGNTDGGDLRACLPEVATLEIAALRVVVVHGHQLGSPTPAGLRIAHATADIVVFGHTHRPANERVAGALFVNPGSAGAPRFGLAPSIALLEIGEDVSVRFITL
jgi:putative phosphoesterase